MFHLFGLGHFRSGCHKSHILPNDGFRIAVFFEMTLTRLIGRGFKRWSYVNPEQVTGSMT